MLLLKAVKRMCDALILLNMWGNQDRLLPRGVYMTRGLRELHIANPKKHTSLKFYIQKNIWHQSFLPKKIQDLNTSILIYSIKQTLLIHDFESV